MLFEIFSPVFGFSFNSLNRVFWGPEVFNLFEVKFINYTFYRHCFLVSYIRNILHNSSSQRIYPCFIKKFYTYIFHICAYYLSYFLFNKLFALDEREREKSGRFMEGGGVSKHWELILVYLQRCILTSFNGLSMNVNMSHANTN